MSSVRALANEKLYHAKILIQYWRSAQEDEKIAASVLAGAFGPAICEHLADAYGWFLLEIAQPEVMPVEPPRFCRELPPPPEGREIPPEIQEFQRLENQPWLAQILGSTPLEPEQSVSRFDGMANLAVATEPGFDPAQAEQAVTRLDALFDRMTDSLDEY